jgi:parvulin-like peptidyl-prolyl isomerase
MLKSERNVTPQQYKRDIIWPTMALKKLAADKLVVSQEELDREMEAEYGPKVQVRMISLTSKSAAEKVLALAQRTPERFPALAKQYSEDPASASAQGLIPHVRRHLGEPEVEKVVFAMQPGEVSPIVHAANQYLIFRCEKHIPAATISPQFRQSAIEQLQDRIVERNLRGAANELLERLQSGAKIVNVFNDPNLRKQHANVAAFVNERPITIEELIDECVARYGRDMLETEINFRLLNQALKARQLAVTKEALNDEVARAAASFGYLKKDGSADVAAWVAKVTEEEGIGQQEYIRDAVWPSVALKQLVSKTVNVTDEDLQKGFEANYGQRVEVLAIVLGNQRVAQQVWDMARKNNTKEFFGQLAEQYSIEPVSRANYGEIPPIRMHGGQPQIEMEAFRLGPDDSLSGIVAVGDKYIIMRYLGRTEPIVENLDDVRPELMKDIHEKKLRLAMAEEFDRLREAAQIDNFIAKTSQSGRGGGAIPGASSKPAPPQRSAARGLPVVTGPKQR